ncbi:hypothetical protein HZS_4940, partial [Henneguya salminicola]
MLYLFRNKKNINFFANNMESISISPESASKYKMVIVLRKDLKLSKGKAAAQCCRASLGVYKISKQTRPNIIHSWENEGSGKIVLRAHSENELHQIYEFAQSCNIPTALIRDMENAGLEEGTPTAVAIGPGL